MFFFFCVLFFLLFFFFFKQKTAYEISACLVGSEMCIRDRDVEGRVALHAQIRALQAQGKTIVLASHDMAEVESLCSRIGILNRGELVFLGTVTELTAHIGSRYLVCVRTAQGEERFEADDVGEALLPLLEAYKRCGVAVLDVTVGRGTLEQHFMDIAKEDV